MSTKRVYQHHDTSTKYRLIGAINAGLSVRASAKLVGIPSSSAQNIYRKYLKTGSTADRPRSGRPPKLTASDKRLLIRNTLKDRRMPFAELANTITTKVSPSTVRDVLAAQGYHRRISRTVPFLTAKQKYARLVWAREHQWWGQQEWRRVIFSDECYICLGERAGHVLVTRRAGEEFNENCVTPRFKQSSLRIMIWGCIIHGRKGPLVVLKYPRGCGGGMTAKRYQEQVLDGVLLDFYRHMKSPLSQVYFQQDGAPSHTSKSTTKWFSVSGIRLLPHPVSSPNVNPTKSIWHELKQRLRALPCQPTTIEELKTVVKRIWDEILVEVVNTHIESMPERVHAVLATRGGQTKF